MKSFIAVAIFALACSASANVIRSFPSPVAYSAPWTYYYQPSIRTVQTPFLHTVQNDLQLEAQHAWQRSFSAPIFYSSPTVESPKSILTKSIQAPLVWQNANVLEAPKTTLLKGLPAPIAYQSYAYTPIVQHEKVAFAQPEPSYIASNLGATHTAPLPGHSESVISQNLEPANGTA